MMRREVRLQERSTKQSIVGVTLFLAAEPLRSQTEVLLGTLT